MTTLYWLRNDFRLHDNPALNAATQRGNVIAVYILEANKTPTGARDWWLHHTLEKFSEVLAERGIPLLLLKGHAEALLPLLATEQKCTHAYWNRRYHPQEQKADKDIAESLISLGVSTQTFAGNVLAEPTEIATQKGTPFKVYTPFFETLYKRGVSLPTGEEVDSQVPLHVQSIYTCTLNEFALVNEDKTWHRPFDILWKVGEEAALKKLYTFLEEHLLNYKEQRDFPAQKCTSMLSPHLHFGEISAKTVWQYTLAFAYTAEAEEHPSVITFLKELTWRDFAHQQLYHFPSLESQPIQPFFAEFPWQKDAENLRLWQQGKTGIPLVDAGMRELWKTGYMHNRVRMITASFLTKNLLISWQEGAKWFMDTLIDADEANNYASWQWVAGCGLDAAPYFRIFNPETQAKRFDSEEEYIRKWVPEYGTDAYPEPIVDLRQSRQRALDVLSHLKR